MELIHADASFHEKGVVDFLRFDAMISLTPDIDRNDWEMQIPAEELGRYGLALGDYLYVPYTEWGGRVERFVHLSDKGIVKVGGVSWRGMLLRKVMEPPAGQTHRVFLSCTVAEIIDAMLQSFGGVFVRQNGRNALEIADQNTVCEEKKYRYQSVFEAVTALLDEMGDRLELMLDPERHCVLLYICKAADRSDALEFSGDYDLPYTSTKAAARINHLIALGRGEMENRVVRHFYLLPNGSITENSAQEGVAVGVDERTTVYDYPNYENESELVRCAKNYLRKYGVQDEIEFQFDAVNLDLPLGDRVGIRDRLTGMAAVKTITEKLLTVSPDDGTRLKYSVG
ncbi:MAG: hypothetical protein IIZ68_10660 [Clostridia bacterium]|nr:hypothetical protein [Clostridia bacterium]MBQ5544200.1 hypothetical protein [Clostridia bacterium]